MKSFVSILLACLILYPVCGLAKHDYIQLHPRVETLEHHLEVTAHRKGRQLCEALLFHIKNKSDVTSWTRVLLDRSPINSEMSNSPRWHNIREGSRQWAATLFRAFVSKANHQLITELFGIGPQYHADWLSLTTQNTLELTGSEDFHKGLVYCAMTNNVDDPETLAEGIKQILLTVDQNTGRMGVIAGLTVDITILGGAIIGAIKVISVARQFFASTAFHRWLFQPRTITEIIKSPFLFLTRSIVRSRWRIAAATAGVAIAIGYDHYQIRKEHQAYQANQTSQMAIGSITAFSQSITQSEWPVRTNSYQQNIILKLDQAAALPLDSEERFLLEAETSIYLDHYLKDYHLIAMRLEDLREYACSTGNGDHIFENEEYFLNEVLEHLRVRKIKLETELLDRQAERVASDENYNRYGHLMILFELMELNRMRAANEDYDIERWRELIREIPRIRDTRLESLYS